MAEQRQPGEQGQPGEPTASGRRRLFGITAVSSLAAGTLVAVAGTRDAVSVEADSDAVALVTAGTTAGDALTMPLVTSLALVVLAAWGVLLVTRGLVRRMAAVLALAASLGALVAALVAQGSLRGTVDDALAQVGASGGASLTGWYVAAVVGAVDLSVSAAIAVWQVPDWPEMGQRYDAPAAPDAGTPFTHADADSPLDLWKAMDEGHDPTDRSPGSAP